MSQARSRKVKRDRSGTGVEIIARAVAPQRERVGARVGTKARGPVTERPCTGCPFLRRGGVKGLSPGRVRDALKSDSHFLCHKTTRETGNGTNRVCAGWAAVLVKEGGGGQMFRILGRIGALDHVVNAEWLDEVCDSIVEAEAAQREGDR
jgi:hypothetical protein